MEEVSNTSNDREFHPVILEYNLNDVKLSIQEISTVIEKFVFDREITKR
jgi:hypothetical protein